MYIYTYIYIYSRKKVFAKDSMSKHKKMSYFYLFGFLDYQMNYYEV